MAKKLTFTMKASKLERAGNLAEELKKEMGYLVSALEHTGGIDKNLIKHARTIKKNFESLIGVIDQLINPK